MPKAVTNIRRSLLPVFVLLFAVALAGYFQILNNALVSDDYFFVNRTAGMPVWETWRVFTLLQVLLRPLPIMVWWLQVHLFGGEGLPSHLIDIGFHAAAAWALFVLLARKGCARLTALLAAVLFILAPVGPDAVTWSAARMDTMALFLVLVAIILYLNYLRSRRKWIYAASLVAGAAALLSKEAALILVFLMPAAEALFGGEAPGPEPGVVKISIFSARLKTAALRQIPFFLMFAGYFVLRLALLGGIGGYTNVTGIPRLRAVSMTLWTFISPLNNQIFSKEKIIIFGLITGLFWALSTSLVIYNWRRASAGPRRLWLLFSVFLVVSTLPVSWFLFVVGLNHSMQDSRFLYFPTLAFTAMTVLGLFEFGFKSRYWRAGITGLLLLMALIYFWGVQGNNRLWEHASNVVTTVSDESVELAPDPPLNSSFYYRGLDQGLGVFIFGTNLQELIRWKYDRGDLRVSRGEPEIESRRDAPIYFFSYDSDGDELRLTSTLPLLNGP